MVKLPDLAPAELDPERKRDYLLDTFRDMTLLELHDFIRAFKTAFDVDDIVPAITQVQQETPAEAAEEQTEFTVTLEAIGPQKIQVIKTVREILKLGLAEAKAFTEGAPRVVLANVDKLSAETAKGGLETAGATVSIR